MRFSRIANLGNMPTPITQRNRLNQVTVTAEQTDRIGCLHLYWHTFVGEWR